MKAEAREAISNDVAQIVDNTKELLAKNITDSTIVDATTQALMGISSTLCTKEEGPLTNVVPVLIDCFKAHPENPQGLAIISLLTYALP